jgi:thiol-disulfide isomerase/thioredoxin
MLRHRIAIIALAAVFFAVTASAPADLKPADSRKTAPDFSLEDSSGALIKLSSYQGRVVLLYFWATWCTGCKQEIPWYMEFQDKYKKSGLSPLAFLWMTTAGSPSSPSCKNTRSIIRL